MVKRKKSKHIFIGLVGILFILFKSLSNLSTYLKDAGIYDFYTDNSQTIIYGLLAITFLYTVIIFYEEYSNQTMEQLVLVPIKPIYFILSKWLFIMLYSLLMTVLVIFFSVIFLAFSGFKIIMSEVLIVLIITSIGSVTLSCAMFPVVLLILLFGKELYLSLPLNILFIVSCFFMYILPINESKVEKIIAYCHPVGSYALIHNTLVYRLIPHEITMMKLPKQD